MSKKKFSNDLNSLFGFSTEVETFQEENPLLSKEDGGTATLVAPLKVAKEKPAAKVEKKRTPRKTKKRMTKNFHADLEELFQEAFQEKMEELKQEDKKPAPKRVRRILPRMGLDNLIRNTQQLSPEEIKVNDDQKRVTFLYSKKQLEKLRNISKQDSRYMKDIIGEAVTKWLKDYREEME